MERAAVNRLMELRLQEVGFIFDKPSLRVAWAAFRSFAPVPLAGLSTITVGFSCDNADYRDDVLWLSFMRRLEEPSGLGWSCGCLFSIRVPEDLRGIADKNWWWPEHGGLDDWAAAVEAMPAFQRCCALDGWRWEGFSE